MATVQVTFEMSDMEDEAWFIRQYLCSAWDRFEAMDAFEKGWFWRHGRYSRHDVDYFDGGRILLMIDGDPMPSSNPSATAGIPSLPRTDSCPGRSYPLRTSDTRTGTPKPWTTSDGRAQGSS